MTASHKDQRTDVQNADSAGSGTQGPGVVQRRRRLIRVGLYAAPVLSSLAGRSALGACYSPYAHFSGNVSSHPEYADGACTSGKSPSCYISCASKNLWTFAVLSFPSFNSCSGDPRPIKCNEFNNGSALASTPYSLSSGLRTALATGCNSSSGNTVNGGAWGTQFGTIFGFSTPHTDLENSPVWLVLAFPLAYGGVGSLAAQLIAAYINSKNITGYPLKPKDVTDMWAARATGWCPNAYNTCPKTAWGAAEIMGYLQNINTAPC